MSGLLSLLLFAAFFYLMMRFGCGAHMVHGGHGGHGRHGQPGPEPVPVSKDPVCGMEVDSSTGYVRLFNGRAYRICSRQCLDKFDAAPEQYAA